MMTLSCIKSPRRHNWPKDFSSKEIMCTTSGTPVITQGETASRMISQFVFIAYCLETNSCFSFRRGDEWLSELSSGKDFRMQS